MKGKPAVHEPYPDWIQAVQALPYGIRGFRAFCRGLGLKIHPYQAFILALYFSGVRELVILIPKKNGKTTLLAALALYHLLMTPKAECVIGAAARDQATIMLDAAKHLIRDAGLERHALPGDRREPTRYAGVFEVREGYRMIRFEEGRIRVLAHGADNADGIIPTLALIDELHRHPDGSYYGVFRDGLLGDAQMVTISTAGASMDSPLGKLLEDARTFAMETVKRRTTYTAPNGSFVVVEWALRPEDDTQNLRTVKSVNPAPWHTTATLRERRDSPSTSPGQWLRFACNLWTAGEEPVILPKDWDPLYADIGQIRDGDEVVLAPSIGHDAAIGIASARGDRVAVRLEMVPNVEGRSVLADTEDRIVELCKRYRVLQVAHPVRSKIRSFEILQARKVPVVEHPDVPTRLAAWTAEFERLLRSGALIHDGDPVLRSHVLAAELQVSETGERFHISEQSRGLIAVAAAVHALSAYEAPTKPRIHTYRGA